jgi:hypothetical protein
VQYALGVAEVGPDKVFVDLNEFGFVDLGADGLVTAVPRRFEPMALCRASDDETSSSDFLK